MNQINATKRGAFTSNNNLRHFRSKKNASNSNNRSSSNWLFVFFIFCLLLTACVINIQTIHPCHPPFPLPSSFSSNYDNAPPPSLRIGQAQKTAISKVSSVTKTKKKRYAYAFYATDEGYACGALVNIAALREAGTTATTATSTTDFIILTYGLNTTAIEQEAVRMGDIILKPVEHLKNFKGGGEWWYQGESSQR